MIPAYNTRIRLEVARLIRVEIARVRKSAPDLSYREAREGVLKEADRRSFSRVLKLAIWKKSKGLCAYRRDPKCREPKLNPHKWCADHILPHALGGPTILSNAQAVCLVCNRRKAAFVVRPRRRLP